MKLKVINRFYYCSLVTSAKNADGFAVLPYDIKFRFRVSEEIFTEEYLAKKCILCDTIPSQSD